MTTPAPLVSDSPLLATGSIPAFDRIAPEQVEPAIRTLLAAFHAGFDRLEATVQPTWDGSIAAVTSPAEPLAWAWGVVNHLMGVRNSPALRNAHQAVQGDVVSAFLRLGQSRALYEAYRQIDGSQLDAVQQRVVRLSLIEMELSGVALQGAAKERFTAIEQELAELATRYENQLIDATKAWSLTLTDPAEVDGLPPTLRAALASRAKAVWQETKAGAEPTPESGPWRLTLDFPIAGPFLEHSRRRDLRECLYRAMVTKASTGAFDNGPVLERILLLRQERAELLGKRSHAEVSLATKMAREVAAAERLLAELKGPAKAKADAELAELRAFARQRSGDPDLDLALWDIGFWAERLREDRYAYTDEELRPYFALPQVLDGLFATAKRLFGVTIRAADGTAPVWHADVRFFRIADRDGQDIAAFYLDPYVRPADKRGGAWMDSALDRKRLDHGSVRQPVAYLVCNQSPPVGDAPSLMTFREVETLFHEFGHGLQHLLTRVEHVEAAGIRNVEWDAVELPSQFMENWCFDPATMLGTPGQPGLARHWRTGEALPKATFDRIVAARTYRAGSMTLRQIYFAQTDLELHHRYRAGGAVTAGDVQRAVARTSTVLPPLPEDRSLCGFSHIFAGGYAAGYYSYKWAEVLSADAFAAFEEAGLDNAVQVAAIGQRFRDTVLALGGGTDPATVFRTFRGRDPSTAALIRHTGLG